MINKNRRINNITPNLSRNVEKNINRSRNSEIFQQQCVEVSLIAKRKRFENFRNIFLLQKLFNKPEASKMPSLNQICRDSQKLDCVALSSQSHTSQSSPPDTTIRHHNIEYKNIDIDGLSPVEMFSEISKNKKPKSHGSTLSLNTVQQKLWNCVPLLKRETSVTSLYNEKSQSIVHYTGLRKCETVLALSNKSALSNYNLINKNKKSLTSLIYNRCASDNLCGINVSYTINSDNSSKSNGIEPIKAFNRLRHTSSTTSTLCSNCSSFLSVAASGSKYSVNTICSDGSNITNHYDGVLNDNYDKIFHKNYNFNFENKKNLNNTSFRIYHCKNNTCSATSLKESGKNSTAEAVIVNRKIVGAENSRAKSINGSITTDKFISSFESSNTDVTLTETIDSSNIQQQNLTKLSFICKLCLNNITNPNDATQIAQCNCYFCTECLKAYIDFEISEGAYQISCPDAECPSQGTICLTEITSLVSAYAVTNYCRYRLNREIEQDKTRTWCPRAGCETICLIESDASSYLVSSDSSSLTTSSATSVLGKTSVNWHSNFNKEINTLSEIASTTIMSTLLNSTGTSSNFYDERAKFTTVPHAVRCPTCFEEFCSGCKKSWHPIITCDENARRLTESGQENLIGIPFDSDTIKLCPMCAVPIEKDEGCAQMMCKRCKHVFCWYCLASLDDDFLLRHYDKGPCKNKLGHSRASVVWHRAQVIGIFAGFGILLLVASPLLLLAAPCIICCKCRICANGKTKFEDKDAYLEDPTVLQR